MSKTQSESTERILSQWESMNDEIIQCKEQLELINDKIELKQREKVEERYELFRKKYEKIVKMRGDY